jgi:hypothetical protein
MKDQKYKMEIVFHYPPELLNLLIDTIPRLCRFKKDVLLFFKGAGVSSSVTDDLENRLNENSTTINKFEIVRTVLTRLNERGEATLQQRREILKRVIEFEDFSTCWPSDQLKAKGLAAEIRRVVNVKDSFTRMGQEREEERRKRQAEHQAKLHEKHRQREQILLIKNDLFALFKESNPYKRGKALENVLNRLFDADGILIRESFTLTGIEGEGIVEQIDGVVEIDGNVYLVEMKWWDQPLGPGDVAQHLVRVFFRGHARGIFISNLGYTQPAITSCRDALQKSVVVLCKLEEFVFLLEKEKSIKEFLRSKINAAIVHKTPLYEPLSSDYP